MGPDGLNNVVLVLFGMCVWNHVISLWFEYRLLTKKIRFRWQFVPYFLARYSVLVHIALDATAFLIDFTALSLCTRASLITASLLFGDLAIVFSTWNFLTRTIIIWGNHPLVMKPCLAIGFLQFALSLILSSIRRPSCIPLPPRILNVMILGTTTTVIELAILVLSLIGIRRASQHRESHLARLLKTQGAIYFVMAASLHVSTMIATLTRTDGFTGTSVGILGSTLGPLLSCRLVTSTLSQDFHADGNPETQTHSTERPEPPEDPSSTRMTTCIDITKDPTATAY